MTRESPWAIVHRLGRPLGIALLAALLVALILTLNVAWPLAVVLALVLLLKGAASWRGRPVLRVVAGAAAIAAVALAFEADRLRYQLDVSCVELLKASGSTSPCGILVGQNDRGIYVGVPPPRSGRYSLVFVPAAQVKTASSQKEARWVIDEFAEVRRRPLVERLLGFRVH